MENPAGRMCGVNMKDIQVLEYETETVNGSRYELRIQDNGVLRLESEGPWTELLSGEDSLECETSVYKVSTSIDTSNLSRYDDEEMYPVLDDVIREVEEKKLDMYR